MVSTPPQFTPPPELTPPAQFTPPPPPWSQRINWRLIVLGAIVLTIVGVPFYIWLDEVVTGGIHDYGSFKEVDLKAMSTFDMDQRIGTMDDIPQKFRQLEGKRCMMVGEMWNPRGAGDDRLGYFQLVYSKTKCCFNGPPLAQHFVDGNVVRGSNIYYYDTPVKVWGTVHVSIHKDAGVIKSIYHVDVDKVEPIDG
jgi:hypothetical protein